MRKFQRILTSYATVLFSAAALLGATSCSDDDNTSGGGGDEIKATSISITPVSASLEIAATQTLTVTVTVMPENATDKTYTLESSNTSVATVKDNVVTAVAVGNATITAKCGKLTPATCQITVTNGGGSGGDGEVPTSVTIPNVEFGTVTLSNPAQTTFNMAIIPNDKEMTYINLIMAKADYDLLTTPEALILDDLNFIAEEAGEYEETYLGNLAYYLTTGDFEIASEELDPGTTYVVYAYGMSEDGKTVLSKVTSATITTTGTAAAPAKSKTLSNMSRLSTTRLFCLKPIRIK